MKRVIAILFLFVFLNANTAFGEILKLPILIHHYIEHEGLEKSVSFIDFLNEHYTNVAQHRDYAHHHHDNLPFKYFNSHLSQSATYFQNISFEIKEFFSDNLILPSRLFEYYSNNYLSKIWQPPRCS